MLQNLKEPVKEAIKSLVHKSGYVIRQLDELDHHLEATSADVPLPEGAESVLRGDHPRLRELRQRYAELSQHPAAAHSYWTSGFVQKNVDLRTFRGDNAYVWQMRHARRDADMRYFANTLYVERIDHRKLLDRLEEDGVFGCHRFKYHGRKAVSRDLLDSINEIYFLERHAGLFDQPELRVLDIGAGYGRLAYRMAQAVPNLKSYVCVDAVPESSFLSEYYLQFRGIPPERAEAVPLYEIETLLQRPPFHLAVNVHSFTECNSAAIRWWLQLVSRLNIPQIFIVPNKGPAGSAHDLYSIESDGQRLDFTPLLEEAGYRLEQCVPKYDDPHLQMGVRWFAHTQYYLFRKIA